MLDRLVDFVIQFAELFRFWVILEPYDEGVMLRLGKFTKTLGPGLTWKLPFGFETALIQSVVPTTHSLGNESITTKDGKGVGFHSIVTYQIRDIKKALLDVADTDHALRDACAGEIGRVLREHNWCDIIGSVEILDELTAACRKRGFRYGIEVMSVQLAGLALVKSIRLMQ